jgi:hypothetical protein
VVGLWQLDWNRLRGNTSPSRMNCKDVYMDIRTLTVEALELHLRIALRQGLSRFADSTASRDPHTLCQGVRAIEP